VADNESYIPALCLLFLATSIAHQYLYTYATICPSYANQLRHHVSYAPTWEINHHPIFFFILSSLIYIYIYSSVLPYIPLHSSRSIRVSFNFQLTYKINTAFTSHKINNIPSTRSLFNTQHYNDE
jgi:hypothetical protein